MAILHRNYKFNLEQLMVSSENFKISTSAMSLQRSVSELTAHYLVGAQGFEPWTYRLKADCSTAELYPLKNLAPRPGFEPGTS